MSLSDGQGKRQGRIVVGLGGNGLSQETLERMQGTSRGWSAHTEEEYMRRVQEKAADRAREIVADAMREAQEIRERAFHEGLNEAAAQCQAQLDAAVDQSAITLAQAMSAVQEGSDAIWQRHRQDIVTLVRLAVERLLAVELDSRREEVLAALLDQALDAIDTHKGLVIRIRPEDEEIMQALLERAKAAHPDLERWGLRVDPALAQGGMVLESEEGMVDNSVSGRFAAVAPVFDQLGIVNGDNR
ncbi:flagellar assembly protein FliH [Desulfobaculum xiamenense]|uniref:Flagellar assembly protein FliH n=1 Tax=Desulfobaculum xiamenense TaxID=995050 RepID=A0A846QX90_9BACT|nr:FliH/SctL family protein [Desulfobaculum xiamenense]NJB69239.1 flagellar assembly protein FliH [Desulfobaculum xiamenense]